MVWHPIISHLDFRLFSSNRNPEKQGKEKESDSSLWENIRKKRERIKSGSGEKMRKKGDKGAPTPEQIKKAKN